MPGGAVRDLTPRWINDIRVRWPAIDLEAIGLAASIYQISREHQAETPREVRKKMDKIVKLAIGLRLEMQTLSEEARDHLWGDFQATGSGDLFQSLVPILDRLKGAAMRSHNAEIGNDARTRTGARHQLISSLATQLERIGAQIDARANGHLCLLAGIVLEDLGEAPGDLSRTIREALDRRQSSASETIASG